MSLQNHPTEPITPIQCGLTKVWLADGRILCYRFNDMTRSTVDAAAVDARTEMAQWDVSRPWLVLMDIRRENVVVSAYALHRVREITRLHREVRGKTAILTSSILTTKIASMALRGMSTTLRQRFVFTDEAEAIAWLLRDATIYS